MRQVLRTFAFGSVLMASVSTGAVTAQSAENEPVMFVVDGSNSMWGQMDGASKIDLTKKAFRTLLPGLHADRPVGLVMYGHRQKANCQDIEMVSAPGTGNRDSLTKSVDGISPRGKTPISAALKTAADALPKEGGGSIVLLSDGIETCGADPCELAKSLKDRNINFTIHVVGVDIRKPEDKAALACIAERTGGKFTDVTSADDLSPALKQSANSKGDTEMAERFAYELKAIDGMEGPVLEDAVFDITSATDESVIASDIKETYDFLPGDYIITAKSGQRTGAVETRVFKDDKARTITVVINAALPTATLDFETPVEASSVLSVIWEGPDGKGDFIEVTDADGKRLEDSYFVYTADGSPSMLRVPSEPGTYKLRYIYASRNAPIAEKELVVTPALADLNFEASAEVGTLLEVSWTGPAGEGDFIGIYAAGDEAQTRSPISYERVAKGNSLQLELPGLEGDYEIRYVTGNDATVLAAKPMKLTPAVGAIEAPASAERGQVVDIGFSGTFNKNQDYVTIVASDAGRGEYTEYVYVDGSEPVQLRAPDGTGAFEIRVVREAGGGNEVLFSKALTLVETTASLTAPESVSAEASFTVVPVGTVCREGDDDVYITIARPDEGAGSYSLGYEYVMTSGEAVALTAPSEPGTYEVRYVTVGKSPMILTKQTLIVN